MATQAKSTENETNLESYLGWLAIVLAAALPLYRPWVTLATTAILVLWLFGGGLSLRAGRLRNHRLTLAVLFFIALNVVSLVWSSDPGAGLRYITKYRYLLLIPMLASFRKADLSPIRSDRVRTRRGCVGRALGRHPLRHLSTPRCPPRESIPDHGPP